MLTYQTNPQLQAQRAQLRATDQMRGIARAGRRPVIGLQADITDSGQETEFPAGGGLGMIDPSIAPLLEAFTSGADVPTKNVGISITQPLFQGFRVHNAIKQADASVASARAHLLAAEQGLFAETIATYLSVANARETVALSRTSVTLLEEQLHATRIRFDAGQTTRTDIAQSEARLAQGNALLIQSEAQLDSTQLSFARIVGQAPATLHVDMPLPSLPGSLEEALAVARQQNLQLLAAKADVRAAEYGVKSAKGAMAPTLNATAQYGRGYDSFVEDDETERASVGVQLTMPFYQGGREYATVRQARYGAKASRYSLEATRRSVDEQVSAAWQNFLAADASFIAAQAGAKANALAFRGVKLENEVGQRTTLEVLNAEQENLNAKLNVLRARQSRYQSAYELRRLMGSLTAEALGLDVAIYDAEALSDRDARKWVGFGD